MEEIKEEVKVEEEKEPVQMRKYEDIIAAVGSADDELILLLNELTLARNLKEKAITKKEFGVVTVAFKSGNKTVKRAGVYNKEELTEDEAEDLVLSEDLKLENVIIVPRESIYLADLK